MKRVWNIFIGFLLFIPFVVIFVIPMLIVLIKSYVLPGKNVLIVYFFGERKWITVLNKVIVNGRTFVTFNEDGLVYLMELKCEKGLYLINVGKEKAREILEKLGYKIIKEEGMEVPEGGR